MNQFMRTECEKTIHYVYYELLQPVMLLSCSLTYCTKEFAYLNIIYGLTISMIGLTLVCTKTYDVFNRCRKLLQSVS